MSSPNSMAERIPTWSSWPVRLTVATAVVLASTAGCGRGDRLPTYAARGTVIFPDGEPLPGGTIIFESAEHRISARGVIDVDGSFELSTYEEGDGAVAGRHRVAIAPPVVTDVDPDEVKAPPVLDPRFVDVSQSGLEYTVSPEGRNDFRVIVQKP